MKYTENCLKCCKRCWLGAFITVSPRIGMYIRRFDSSWHMQDARFQNFFRSKNILPSKYYPSYIFHELKYLYKKPERPSTFLNIIIPVTPKCKNYIFSYMVHSILYLQLKNKTALNICFRVLDTEK